MNYQNLDDRELVQLLREENQDAFAEIYYRYWKRIYALALSYLKSPEAAQDIVQEAFVKIWLNREYLLQVKEFRPYLFVIARNLVISELRKTVFHSTLDPGEKLEEELYLPDSQLSYKESVRLLHQAIELLPPQQQRAYQLSRNEGKRYEDIALEMGISRLTVRSHMTKAIDFIRNYLKERSVHPVILLLFGLWTRI